MIVGVLREIKPDEYRVGMVPADVEELVSHGPDVIIEKAAGLGSGLDDEACARLGLAAGISIEQGQVACEVVARTFGIKYQPADLN